MVFRKELPDATGPRELLLIPALLPEARPPELKQRWKGTVHVLTCFHSLIFMPL